MPAQPEDEQAHTARHHPPQDQFQHQKFDATTYPVPGSALHQETPHEIRIGE